MLAALAYWPLAIAKAALLALLSVIFVGCAMLAFCGGALALLALAVYMAGWQVRAWLAGRGRR